MVRRMDRPLRSYTSHCQATFWLGLVSVLWRNGRIRIRRAKRRKSVNICMYIYNCILINNILINLAGVFEIKCSAGGGAGAVLSPVRCFFSVERLVSLTGIVQKPAGDILTFIIVDHIVKQVFLIFISTKYWIHSICKLRIAGYYNANNQMKISIWGARAVSICVASREWEGRRRSNGARAVSICTRHDK